MSAFYKSVLVALVSVFANSAEARGICSWELSDSYELSYKVLSCAESENSVIYTTGSNNWSNIIKVPKVVVKIKGLVKYETLYSCNGVRRLVQTNNIYQKMCGEPVPLEPVL